MKNKEKIYGLNADPWPYDYVVDSLIFFSLSEKQRTVFLNQIDLDKWIEYTSEEICDHIVQGFAENIRPGLTINDWVDDEELENAGLERDFHDLRRLGMARGTSMILLEWERISMVSNKILGKLGWSGVTEPFTTAEKMLMDYKFHDQGNGWGW